MFCSNFIKLLDSRNQTEIALSPSFSYNDTINFIGCTNETYRNQTLIQFGLNRFVVYNYNVFNASLLDQVWVYKPRARVPHKLSAMIPYFNNWNWLLVMLLPLLALTTIYSGIHWLFKHTNDAVVYTFRSVFR